MAKKYSASALTLLLILTTTVSGCNQSNSSSGESSEAAVRQVPTPTPTPEPLTVSPVNPDPVVNAQAIAYVKSLAPAPSTSQGVWMQAGDKLLANHQGTVPLQAASITKVATTLVALKTLGPNHRYVTQIGTNGVIKDGVLQGDLIIQGGEDPFFVWEEAIKLGNTLNSLGIKRIKGNLAIAGPFYMNFSTTPATVGNLLKRGLNSKTWTPQVTRQHATLPPQTPKPQVVIDGSITSLAAVPADMRVLVRHSSYPLAELLKKMNNFSNNPMSEMIANSIGGAQVIAQRAAEYAQFPANEIYLINGSGLTYENKISPRAAIAMFRAVENYLRTQNMTVADVFTVTSLDKGVLAPRKMPPFAVVKSGSLNTVSALVGALPTQSQGTIWFAVMNGQGDLKNFRIQQDVFLTKMATQWGGAVAAPPTELATTPARQSLVSQTEILQQQ